MKLRIEQQRQENEEVTRKDEHWKKYVKKQNKAMKKLAKHRIPRGGYHWLPSIVQFNEQGEAKFKSCIHNVSYFV